MVVVVVVVVEDMVHTMLIFLQQQDMQHLVLLPYTTIQSQFMVGVCISDSILFYVMLGLGEYCYDDSPFHWIRKGISRDGKKDFYW